ncbi:MAG: alkaline phosphatase D family protein [Acidimicrobiales bacterium]
MARPADPPEAWTGGLVAGERFPGRWTDVNVFFPHAGSVAAIRAQRPDLVVFNGDQYYETVPTGPVRAPAAAALEDLWHRVLLWHWSFRDLTRDRPTVVLLDDHDVYHPNLWGWEGRPTVNANTGGYVMPPTWINAVQAMLCGHLPDPYDPTPVSQGIGVIYTAFRHGPVNFAVLEDRKFKTGDKDELGPDGAPFPPEILTLLGSRQEDFLDWWATQDPGAVKICLHQSPFVSMKTGPTGFARRDADSNGYPASGRRSALTRLQEAGAVLVSGDQHLAAVMHHGIDGDEDGPWEFAAPALGTLFQLWFEPNPPLPGATLPGTGRFTDPYGNRTQVEAVAGPKVSFSTLAAARTGQVVPDRRLKQDGYGMVVVDPTAHTVTFECWPHTGPGQGQYPGWPVTVDVGP